LTGEIKETYLINIKELLGNEWEAINNPEEATHNKSSNWKLKMEKLCAIFEIQNIVIEIFDHSSAT